MNQERLFPYLTPPGYPSVPGLTKELGHDIQVNYVEDLNNIVKGILSKDVSGAMTATVIRESAQRNLDRAVVAGEVELRVYEGPGDQPLIVSSGSWLSASTLVWSGLFDAASEHLKTDQILASIPHRDALLLFPFGPFSYREVMRAFVKENEGDGRKPLTWELFRITLAGVSSFKEND